MGQFAGNAPNTEPQVSWENFLELSALIRSNTTLNIYNLGSETPETKLKGITSDISSIAKFAWYDWGMFLDDTTYPANKWVFGHWLGPSQDIGPVLCIKILKHNSQVVHCSSYCHPTGEEHDSQLHIAMQMDFDCNICNKLGTHVAPADFLVNDSTPEWVPYDNDL